MLHTAPITTRIKEPTGNPFHFREKEPLRKEIRNYFGLTCTSDSYRYQYLPFYSPEPFPVLEPISSPEFKQTREPEPSVSKSKKSHKKGGYRSKISFDDTLKEVDENGSDSRSKTPEERRAHRDHLSLGSSETEHRRIKKSNKKSSRHEKHKKSSRREKQKQVSDSSAHHSSTTTEKVSNYIGELPAETDTLFACGCQKRFKLCLFESP